MTSETGAGEGIRTLDPNLGKVGTKRCQAPLSLLAFSLRAHTVKYTRLWGFWQFAAFIAASGGDRMG